MEKDEKILNCISKKQYVSQRELAAQTGLSLGNVNLVVRKMIKDGFVRMERLKPNTLRYILTPKGITEKTKKTYRYILKSVRHVLQLKQELESINDRYSSNGYKIFLYGKKDDIRDILEQVPAEGKLRYIQWMENMDELKVVEDKTLVVVWQMEKEQELKETNIEFTNLLYKINEIT